jgi:hypothetical protein
MSHAKAASRLSILAIGLGIGAAAAATSPIAAAQPGLPVDPVPVVPDLALPAPATMNLAISIDGISLVHEGTAVAKSGIGGIAMASGAGSFASAGFGPAGGLFDTAFATGTNSDAESGGGNFDSASANGTTAIAISTDGNYDSVSANGTDSQAFTEDGNFDNAFSSGGGIASVGGVAGNLSNFDSASAVGPNTLAEAGLFNGFTGPTGGDVATVFDPSGTVGSQALAGNGIDDIASVFGDNSSADAGLPGSFDLAAVFGNHLMADAIGGNFMVDILPHL